MNRLDRLTAILTSLQSNRWKTAEELAARYGVSVRTIYRDVHTLQEAGVPVLSEAGRGYCIMEGYRLPPVMFNREEALALLTGEKLLQKQSDRQLRKDYRSAMEKVTAVLRNSDKEFLEALESKLHVYHYPVRKDETPDEKLFHYIQEAIYHCRLVQLSYFSPDKDEVTQRKVEPLGLMQMSSHWYLAGWCRLRNDYRSFRLDRVRKYEDTGEQLPKKQAHTLDQFIRRYEERGNARKVTLIFRKEIIRYIGEQKYYHGWIGERPVADGIEMNFLVDSMESFSRWLIFWGKYVKILEPDILLEKIREIAKELSGHYQCCG